jgi:hypothetical protein
MPHPSLDTASDSTGWAMLAVLSVRYTTRPQRGAAVPAAFMGLDGILLIGFGPLVRDALDLDLAARPVDHQ